MALAGAGRTLPAQWLARLLPYTHIYAALDADKAGTLNATRLAALAARVTAVRVPEGNDVTEYYQASGDVRAWVMAVVGGEVAADGRWEHCGSVCVDPEKLNFNDSTRIVHKNFILIRYTVNNLKMKGV